MPDVLHIWTIYDHPRDMPDVYVARAHAILPGTTMPTDHVIESYDLEALRDRMRDMGLVCLPRAPGDDPVIVESWL